MRDTFVALQAAIEAVERAILHEEQIAHEPVETFTLPTPQPAPAVPTVDGAPVDRAGVAAAAGRAPAHVRLRAISDFD